MMKRRHPETELHGRDEAAAWLAAMQLAPAPHWYVETTLVADSATRFHLNVYAEEWGFVFHHRDRSSWIRVTDIPFIHGRDDFELLTSVPELISMQLFLTDLEIEHGIVFDRPGAAIRSSLPNADDPVRAWFAIPRSRRRTR
jgi:hypothetical protein